MSIRYIPYYNRTSCNCYAFSYLNSLNYSRTSPDKGFIISDYSTTHNNACTYVDMSAYFTIVINYSTCIDNSILSNYSSRLDNCTSHYLSAFRDFHVLGND